MLQVGGRTLCLDDLSVKSMPNLKLLHLLLSQVQRPNPQNVFLLSKRKKNFNSMPNAIVYQLNLKLSMKNACQKRLRLINLVRQLSSHNHLFFQIKWGLRDKQPLLTTRLHWIRITLLLQTVMKLPRSTTHLHQPSKLAKSLHLNNLPIKRLGGQSSP